jgi:hypothetical protein
MCKKLCIANSSCFGKKPDDFRFARNNKTAEFRGFIVYWGAINVTSINADRVHAKVSCLAVLTFNSV